MTDGEAPGSLVALALGERLRAVAQCQPELASVVRLYQKLLPLLAVAETAAPGPVLEQREAVAALAAGAPLLAALQSGGPHAAAGRFELGPAIYLLGEIAIVLQEEGIAGAGELRRALLLDGDSAERLLQATIIADSEGVEAEAAHLAVPAGLAEIAAAYALRPTLHAWRSGREPALARAITRWRRPKCYFCGAPATLAELRGHEGARWLRCVQCGGAWPADRLACAFCGNTEPERLRVLYPEGQREHVRIDTCDACRTYVKTLACFDPLPAEFVPVEDLATLYLDCVAESKGYHRLG